jgi:hypothetical protein
MSRRIFPRLHELFLTLRKKCFQQLISNISVFTFLIIADNRIATAMSERELGIRNLKRCGAPACGGERMAGQFHAESVSCSTRQEYCEAIPASGSNRPGQASRFANDFQRLVGDNSEPDPLFFVECWTLGTPAAVENFQQRRQGPAACQPPLPAFLDLYNPCTLFFLQQRDLDAKSLSASIAAVSAKRCYAAWSRPSPEEPAAPTQDKPPQPGKTATESRESRQETIHSTTRQSACRLLGVTAASTREQIKTAYRRMASQWHPDRLELTTEQARRNATEQMAAINDAYHLLCSCLPQESV